MKQMTYAESSGKRKQTRKEDQVVQGLIALTELHYPKGEGGCPAYPLMAMRLVQLMQNWFGYSDPAMEEALCREHHPVPVCRAEPVALCASERVWRTQLACSSRSEPLPEHRPS